MGSIIEYVMASLGIIGGLMVAFMRMKASEPVRENLSMEAREVTQEGQKRAA